MPKPNKKKKAPAHSCGLGCAVMNDGKKKQTTRRRPSFGGGLDLCDSRAADTRCQVVQSIVSQNDLDEFLSISLAAQKDFAVERNSSTVRCMDSSQLLLKGKLLHPEEEGRELRDITIPIPRRPVDVCRGIAFRRCKPSSADVDDTKAAATGGQDRTKSQWQTTRRSFNVGESRKRLESESDEDVGSVGNSSTAETHSEEPTSDVRSSSGSELDECDECEEAKMELLDNDDNDGCNSHDSEETLSTTTHPQRQGRTVEDFPIEEVDLFSLSAEQLDEIERDAFLCWRRKLARIEETGEIVLTPFERNLDFWRQLWKVVELSDVVVQILDGRNPLLFRCRDLEAYTQEVDRSKLNMVLINKADYLDQQTRSNWQAYFASQGLEVAFYSALLELQRQEKSDQPSGVDAACDDCHRSSTDREEGADCSSDSATRDELAKKQDGAEGERPLAADGTQILDSRGLISLLQQKRVNMLTNRQSAMRDHEADTTTTTTTAMVAGDQSFMVGMVGYPNVGKSSVLNSLFGAKKTSVSRQPGRTKHFQTLVMPSEGLSLCDCPGLVFPSAVLTKFHLLINGITPIDHFRGEYLPAIQLICNQVPSLLCQTYGISPQKAGLTRSGVLDAARFVKLLALSRKYYSGGACGNLDSFRAGRMVLKDYCTGKLVFCHQPPCFVSARGSQQSSAPSTAVQARPQLDTGKCDGGDDDYFEGCTDTMDADLTELLTGSTPTQGKAAGRGIRQAPLTKRKFRQIQKATQRQQRSVIAGVGPLSHW